MKFHDFNDMMKISLKMQKWVFCEKDFHVMLNEVFKAYPSFTEEQLKAMFKDTSLMDCPEELSKQLKVFSDRLQDLLHSRASLVLRKKLDELQMQFENI